jgi:hypothetical protein
MWKGYLSNPGQVQALIKSSLDTVPILPLHNDNPNFRKLLEIGLNWCLCCSVYRMLTLHAHSSPSSKNPYLNLTNVSLPCKNRVVVVVVQRVEAEGAAPGPREDA